MRERERGGGERERGGEERKRERELLKTAQNYVEENERKSILLMSGCLPADSH